MSSGGNIIYVGEYPGGIWKSTNYGFNWSVDNQSLYASWNNLATSYDGKYVTATSDDAGAYVSQDSGNTWNAWTFGSTYDTQSVSMSSGGQYQIVVGNSSLSFRSNDFGSSWIEITGLNSPTGYSASDMSSNGKYQVVGLSSTGKLYNNCTFGEDYQIQNIRIKYANFYYTGDNFNYALGDITGYGNMLTKAFGSGTGFLSNITGQVYQPAIFYQTGLFTGIADNNGSLFIETLNIGGTGAANRVFINVTTGIINATGVQGFYKISSVSLNVITISQELPDLASILITPQDPEGTVIGNIKGLALPAQKFVRIER
jgi:hypothetical protein